MQTECLHQIHLIKIYKVEHRVPMYKAAAATLAPEMQAALEAMVSLQYAFHGELYVLRSKLLLLTRDALY